MSLNRLIKFKYLLVFSILIIVNSCKLKPFVEGELLYNAYCSSCHMENGTGLKRIYPNLTKGNLSILQEYSLACIIRNGIKSNDTTTPRANMPANPKLSAIEISNMVNYINTTFLNEQSVNIKIINDQLNSCGKIQ